MMFCLLYAYTCITKRLLKINLSLIDGSLWKKIARNMLHGGIQINITSLHMYYMADDVICPNFACLEVSPARK